MPKPLLTPENIEFIKTNRLLMSGTEMAKLFGVGKTVVNSYMRKNGLTAPHALSRKWAAEKLHRPFTPEEDNYIAANIREHSIKWITKNLKRTSNYVGKRARLLGFGEIIDSKAEESRIKKGNIPFNKGKKQTDYLTTEQIAKTRLTSFKKGNLPHNTAEKDGDIRKRKDNTGRPYFFIRIALGNWELYHRYLWEKEYGPIPEKHVVTFKDGNSLNCVIGNLKLITMAENAIRNSNHENPSDKRIASYLSVKSRKKNPELIEIFLQHPELLEAKRQSLKLKKLIKNERRNNTEAGTIAK